MANIGSRSTGALSNDPYDATTWDGAQEGATKNVLRDQFVVIQAGQDSTNSLKADKSTTISTTGPLQGGGSLAANRTFSIIQATALADGYLSAADWTTFNNKVATSRAINTTAPLSGGGNLSADRTIAIAKATASVDGYLAATDFSIFNAKQDAGNYITALTGEAAASGPGSAAIILANSSVIAKVLTGLSTSNVVISASDSIITAFGKAQGQISALSAVSHVAVTIGTPNGLSIDGSQILSLAAADTSTTGALTSTDWNTFNNKQSTALTNAKIWIGNISGVATERAISGHVVIANDGAATIQNGVITNAHISNSAAIARSKIAAGTANHVLINDGSGNLSSESVLSPSRGGTGVANDPTQTLTRSGNHSLTIVTTADTNVTLPTSGTLSTLAGVEVLSGKSLSGSTNTFSNIPNSATTATSSNTNSAIVARDASGNFSAGVISASQITLGNAPSASTDAATKQYVDDLFAGGASKTECVVASLSNVSGYSAGVITTGATPASQSAIFDGTTLASGDRVLIKAQTDAKQNGIYVASIVSTNLVLTRASDANTSAELKGASVFVVSGDTLAGTGWVMNAFPFVLDTNNCTFVQNFGAGTYSASGGIVLTANNFAIGSSGTNGISNSMINTAAAIAWSKMAAVSAGSIILGNVSNVATVTAVTGDIGIDSSGLTSISSGVIVNADINSSAAIDLSKLASLSASKVLVSTAGGVISASTVTSTTLAFLDATSSVQTQIDAKLTKTLTSAHIFVGNVSNVGTDVAVTGDISIDNTGLVAIASGVIVNADINASAAIARTKIANGTADHVIINDGSGTFSSEAQLAKTRGGTGISSTATFPSSGTVATVPSSGVVKSNGSVLSASNVALATEVTGTLGVGNGGTGLTAVGTANQIIGANNAASANEYKTLSGTTSQIVVTHGTGTITLSTPQDLATGSSPTFAGLTLTSFSGVVKASAGVLSAASVVNADISASAAIARSKLASGTGDHVVINAADGSFSSEAQLAKTRGGTGVSSTATFPTSGTVAVVPSSGFVKSNGTVLSAVSSIDLTADVSTTVLPIANGGTNGATKTAGFDNLSPVTTRGDIIVRGASNNVRLAVGANQKVLGTDGTDPTWIYPDLLAAKSADYTVTDSDAIKTVVMTTSSTNRTVTLPLAANNTNRILKIKKADTGTGTVIVDGNGSETVDGSLTFTLYYQYDYIEIQCSGTEWFVLSYKVGARSMSNTDATRLGLKEYNHGTTYNGGVAPTVTSSVSGFTCDKGSFYPWQDQDNQWFVRFEIQGSYSANSHSLANLTINGITWATEGSNGWAASGVQGNNITNFFIYVLAARSGSIIQYQLNGAISGLAIAVTGWGKVASKPTWAY